MIDNVSHRAVASDVVLVHGAFHGAWCWTGVSVRLRSVGLVPHIIDLTGLGDRADEAAPDVGLNRHVDDVVDHIIESDLRDVVLVGHSYAGMVITAAASQLAERLRALVYLDASYPVTGECNLDFLPQTAQKALRDTVEHSGQGWYIPAPDPTSFGATDPETIEWMRTRLVPQPLRTFTQAVTSCLPVGAVPTGYIVCIDTAGRSMMRTHVARAELDGVTVERIEAPHSVMVTNPELTATTLIRLIEKLSI